MKLIPVNEKTTDGHDYIADKLQLSKDNPIWVNPLEDKIYVLLHTSLSSLEIRELGRKIGNICRDRKIDVLEVNAKELLEVLNCNSLRKTDNLNDYIGFMVGLNSGLVKAKDYEEYWVKDHKIKRTKIKMNYEPSVSYLRSLEHIIKTLSNAIKTLKHLVNVPYNKVDLYDYVHELETMFVNKNRSQMNDIVIKKLDKADLLDRGYKLITTVNKGSKLSPAILHYIYRPANADESDTLPKIVLVGKGVHFDTGGINLKPSDSMVSMKYDKTGAITALMILDMVSDLNLNIELHVVTGFAENLISAESYKPGDVITAKNGKTIEIINTDAEGRLVLADCLQYVDDEIKDYQLVFTIATLTGAAKRALGEWSAAIHGTDSLSINKFIKTGEIVGEEFVYMKAHEKLKDTLKSKIADIKNVASTDLAGSITAYLFLKEFIKNPDKLIHIDIAGPAWTEEGFGYAEYGATGFGIETFYQYLTTLSTVYLEESKYEGKDEA